jgi:peptide/nickel transport system permease protein
MSVSLRRHRADSSAGLLLRSLRVRRTQIGVVVVGSLLVLAAVGPLVAPSSPTEFVGPPYRGGSDGILFGTDSIGRDVWSRFLTGGMSIVLLAAAATILGVGLGTIIGVTAALSRGRLDAVLMRSGDVLMSIPQIILVLLAMTTVGPQAWLLVVVVGLSHSPRTARVMRGAALDIAYRPFVEAAEAAGEARWRIVANEILPNVVGPLLIEFGLRLTFSIGLIASVSFLGFGIQPPAADWGLMINENRVGLTIQPWGVVLPVVAIALLTVGANLITDGITRVAIGIDRRNAG